MNKQPILTTAPSGSDRPARAVLYLCVASAREPDTTSAAQQEACEQKATELGAHVTEVYRDRGQSVATLERPAFVQMMARIRERHDIDYIIVRDLSRISRNVAESARVDRELRELGVGIVPVIPDLEDAYLRDLATGIVKLVNQFYDLHGVPEAERSFRFGETRPESTTRNESAR